MREPSFWWRRAGLTAALLKPLGAAYGAVVARRMAPAGARAAIPVVCVGNFTLGGSGKTPAAIAIARLLQAAGERPFLLSRGYGGRLAGPVRVDPAHHGSGDVGDEPLLLAHAGPTVVGRDRVAAAEMARAGGASVVVMDDGLQNPALAKDATLAVIDGRRGIGNACVFPAGPLRAPLATQLARTDAILVVGAGDPLKAIAAGDRPIFRGRLEPAPAVVAELRRTKVLAFAGIGDAEKFFATLTEAGIEAPVRKAFADHHRYSGEEAAALLLQAEHEGLSLLTTEKDLARMAGEAALAGLAARSRALPVKLALTDERALAQFLLQRIKTRRGEG